MSKDEVRIVTVRPIGNIVKDAHAASWQGKYVYDVVYVLEDGREIATRNRARLLRDAKATVAEGERHPVGMAAIFHDGEFWGTTQTYDVLSMRAVSA